VSEGNDLAAVAARMRGTLVELSHKRSTAHLGGCLSCVDILVALYWRALNVSPERAGEPDRDRLILSKGHAAMSIYASLAMRGFIDEDELWTMHTPGSRLPEQPSPGSIPGLEAATGSLGHGLPIGVGQAIAARVQHRDYRVFVVMSDGECEEGSVWEAAMFAGARKLERLMVLVDYNKWQATGRSQEVMALHPLADKFEAFGWSAYQVDGHDLDALARVVTKLPDGSGKPVAVIADTVKGKGVSFMEDDNNWHYRIPTEDEVAAAHRELGLVRA
jgi:transketolase